MFSFRVTTLFVAMLVMVTYTTTFAQARPIRSLHHPRRFLLSRHNRNFTQHAGIARRHLVDFTAGVPQQQKPRVRVVRRGSSDDHGDVSAHDQYEAQLHELEAALDHYYQYGDQESLQKYLNGFTAVGQNGSSGKGSENKSGSGDDGAQAPAQDNQSDQNNPAKQDDDKQQQQDPSPQQAQQPSQPAEEPKKMKKVPKKKQSSTDYTWPSTTSQSQPQSQPQPQADQPKSHPESYQQHSSSSSNSGDSGDSNNSINGYTPPSFTTTAAPPSTDSHYTGHATWYNTGLGACGIVNTEDQPIVAVSSDVFQQYTPSSGNPNHNSLCGKKVEISWKGKTVHAFATDECPGCKPTSLDCSPGVFKGLDDPDAGDLDGITWRFL